MGKLGLLLAVVAFVASTAASPALAQRAHEPFLRGDLPPSAWYYDGRDDGRDFQANGFFPGDFVANPAGAWLGAAGIFGSTPSGGSHFGSDLLCPTSIVPTARGAAISREMTARGIAAASKSSARPKGTP